MSKQVVRVYFIDNCVRALGIEQNTTAAQLRELVVERIGLKQDACFALFEKKDDWGNFLKLICTYPVLFSQINSYYLQNVVSIMKKNLQKFKFYGTKKKQTRKKMKNLHPNFYSKKKY